MDRKSLVKRYKDGDKAVRIVPYGFKTERQSVDELLKNPYVISQIGNKDMLDIIKKVAEGVGKNQPYVWALSSTEKDTKRYTTLDSNGNNDGFSLYGLSVCSSRCGCASGVHDASAEGAKPQKI